MPSDSPSSGFWYWLRVAVLSRRPNRTLLRLAVLVVVIVVAFKFAILPIRVTGISMEPAFHDHAINYINRLAYVRGQPQRGDVVGIRFSTNLDAPFHVMLLKRLVGLPGETISHPGGKQC